MEATIEELATHGYGSMSMEGVAVRAGVAKTTVYRRWPTKPELVLAALGCVADDAAIAGGDTGSLRGDLVAMMKSFRDFARTPRGGSLMRMMLAEGAGGEVAALARTMRKSRETGPQAVIRRGIARGELPAGSDPRLILSTLFGVVQHYVLFIDEPCDDRTIQRLVTLVLDGATNGGARPVKRASSGKVAR
jgi:AcrR family transcriptional regulator